MFREIYDLKKKSRYFWVPPGTAKFWLPLQRSHWNKESTVPWFGQPLPVARCLLLLKINSFHTS